MRPFNAYRQLPSLISPSRVVAAALAWLLVSTSASMGQLPQARLYAVYPPGGQLGTTFELTVTSGADLDDIDRLYFNDPGISAIQKRTESNGKSTPVSNTFVVSIDGKMSPGVYEIRAGGYFGVTNPRSFVVGSRREIAESEANNDFQKATAIEINTVVNGRSNARADIDFFRFRGEKGMRVIAACRAARIDSRMQPSLELFDKNRRRLGFTSGGDPVLDVTLPADDEYVLKVYDFVFAGGNEYFYRLSLHTGPHIDFVLPPAGLPNTTGRYAVYGRNLPGGRPTEVKIAGRPLERLNVQLSLPNDDVSLIAAENLRSVEAGLDGMSFVLESPAGKSNPVLIYYATGPVVVEQEPNDDPATANRLAVPGEFAGQFQSQGDIDFVSFQAKAGEVYWIEVVGQRHGNTADPYVVIDRVLVDKDGKETGVKRVTAQDDNGTNLFANHFDTATDDPIYKFLASADATYRVSIRDRFFESRGSPQLVYRLVVRKEHRDFRLVTVPVAPLQGQNNNTAATWPIGLRQGDNFGVRVLAFRRDGFDGRIDVRAAGLPEGVSCQPSSIGPGQNSTTLILSAAEKAPEWYGSIQVVGSARIEDPSAIKAVDTAQATAQQALAALPKAEQALQQATEAAEKAEKAKLALEGAEKPANDSLTKAQSAYDQAVAKLKLAQSAKAAADAKVTETAAAVKQAEAKRQAAVREVSHESRVGTIVWNGDQNRSAIARVAQTLGLSILPETAPYQVTTEVAQVEVNRSRQILVPVKLAKRNGFNNNVTLTFVGQPKNVQIQNKPINKGKSEELLRIFVPTNAPLGTYTLYLRSQGQVSYRRNLPKVARLKAALQEASDVAQAAVDAGKKATAARDAAAAQAAADEKAQKAAAEVVKQAENAKASADSEAAKVAKQAKDAANSSSQQITAAAAAAKKAEQQLQAARDKLNAAQKALAASQAAKTTAEAALKAVDAKAKAASAAKSVADKAYQAAEKESKAKNINVYSPSTPIVLTIKDHPTTLGLSVPGGGNVKRGGKIDVKVTAKRTNGFQGPVTLSLPLPQNVKGLSAKPVTIPADKSEGTLTIQVAADATEGQLSNLVVRASMDFNGKAAVDQELKLKVSK